MTTPRRPRISLTRRSSSAGSAAYWEAGHGEHALDGARPRAVHHLRGSRAHRAAPQTLRLYEQEGLVLPERSSGGTRRYSTDNIDRLRRIMALTSEGVNLAGIRRIFELQEQVQLLEDEIGRLAASKLAAALPRSVCATSSQPEATPM
jgi:DNA-binding transcriptional MerR regulator